MTGTPCQNCQAGHLVCYCSKRIAGSEKLKRFYACWNCGWKPSANKLVVPAETPKRRTTA